LKWKVRGAGLTNYPVRLSLACVNAALAADVLCVVGTYRANIHRFSALSEAQRETGEFQREVG